MVRVGGEASCAVVVAAHNQREFTRRFLGSFRRHTPGATELIGVDNGSDDDTAALFAAAGARVIRNRRNLGVARAWNQGLAAAGARHVCICNNDVVLSPGWLDVLLRELEGHPAAGIVCACDNWRLSLRPDLFPERERIGPGRTWDDLDGAYGGSFDAFAAAFGERHAGVRLAMHNAACMLLRRELVEELGPFDESFGPAWYEDIDYFLRTQRHPRCSRVYVYAGVYVHHFGGATDRHLPSGSDAAAREAFLRKWGSVARDESAALWSNAVITDL